MFNIWWFGFRDSQVATPEVEEASQSLSKEDAQNKKDFIENDLETDNPNNLPSKDNNDDDKPSSPTSDPNVNISASYKGTSVIVTTEISQITDGTCKLDIRNGSKSFNESAPIMYQTAYSTCAGFSVPISSLGRGNWNITIAAKSFSGQTASNEITLKVN